MADSIEALIYDEAQRGLALQPVLVNELRARTGVLLAAITATTALLGALVIDNHKFGFWGVAALVAFIGAGFCALMVLSPHRKWEFTAGAGALLVAVRRWQAPARNGLDPGARTARPCPPHGSGAQPGDRQHEGNAGLVHRGRDRSGGRGSLLADRLRQLRETLDG